MNIIEKDPSELKLHPVMKLTPEWDESDPRMEALRRDIEQRGFDQAIIIDENNRIVDGRHRWRAAKLLQLKLIPARVVKSAEAATIGVQTLLQRRHYTKGQLAYIIAPLVAGAHEESRARQLAALAEKKKQAPSELDEWCERIGISMTLLNQARQVHAKLAESETAKSEWEPKILDAEHPVGLGAVIAGIAGQKATKGNEKRQAEQLDLFGEAWATLATRSSYWPKLTDTQRSDAKAKIRTTLSKLPDDLIKDLSKDIAAEIKRRSVQA